MKSLVFFNLFFTYLILRAACGKDRPPKQYVAVGDSLAAGVGADDAYKGQPQECKQTDGSYAVLFNEQIQPLNFTFLACHNATIDQVRENQVPQIPQDADLVSITAGTMNLNFTDIIQNCDLFINPDMPYLCNNPLSQAEDKATNQDVDESDLVHPDLVYKTMQFLIASIKYQAPSAMIVLLGFPKLFGSPVDTCFLHNNGNSRTVETGKDQKNLINKILDEVNDTLAAVAKTAGVKFINPDDSFNWHRYCDGKYSQNGWQPFLQYLSPQEENCLLMGGEKVMLSEKRADRNMGYLMMPCQNAWDAGYYLPNFQGHGAYKDLLKQAWYG
ncbi:MAG: hypothetical protein Q9160_001464 [Pyrenula sp. 1 TL-2023]